MEAEPSVAQTLTGRDDVTAHALPGAQLAELLEESRSLN
jgi:hypothetical protein